MDANGKLQPNYLKATLVQKTGKSEWVKPFSEYYWSKTIARIVFSPPIRPLIRDTHLRYGIYSIGNSWDIGIHSFWVFKLDFSVPVENSAPEQSYWTLSWASMLVCHRVFGAMIFHSWPKESYLTWLKILDKTDSHVLSQPALMSRMVVPDQQQEKEKKCAVQFKIEGKQRC